MTELVNSLVFSFIFLFGVEAPIYSERSQVTIDTETKTIQIEYFNLQTEEIYLEKVRELLSSFQTPVDLHPSYEGLKLESYSADLNNRTVLLSFDSYSSLNRFFKINLETNQMTVHPGEIISQNGDPLKISSDSIKMVSFDMDGQLLSLEFSRKETELFNGFVSIEK